jgi:hypothetical protein
MAMDAQAVSGGGGISTPLDGQDLSNQVTAVEFCGTIIAAAASCPVTLTIQMLV